MDVVAKDRIREFLLQLRRDRGTTIILTTHDIMDIERLCQRIIIIDKGCIIYNGTLAEIKQQYCHRRRLKFSVAEEAQPGDIEESLKRFDARIDFMDMGKGYFFVDIDLQTVNVSV